MTSVAMLKIMHCTGCFFCTVPPVVPTRDCANFVTCGDLVASLQGAAVRFTNLRAPRAKCLSQVEFSAPKPGELFSDFRGLFILFNQRRQAVKGIPVFSEGTSHILRIPKPYNPFAGRRPRFARVGSRPRSARSVLFLIK